MNKVEMTIFKLYQIFLVVISMPLILLDFFSKEAGREYGVGFFKKTVLLYRVIRNNFMIRSASNFLEHLTMSTEILKIPPKVEGCIIECGSYKGGSTANLSLVATLCKRRLEIFDSFEGLPAPSGDDREHVIFDSRQIHIYSKGAWKGHLEEVKANVSRYGDISICNFNVGYFEETLLRFKQPIAFVFLDVDLRTSLETCLKNLWPLLQDGCYLFTHEAMHMEIASLFFDKEWWVKNLKSGFPGLIGAGSGLGLVPQKGAFKSAIGFTIKNPTTERFTRITQG